MKPIGFRIIEPDQSPWMFEQSTTIALTGKKWNRRIPEVMEAEGITSLSADAFMGWKGDNIEFVSETPSLERLTVRSVHTIDLTPINSLKKLQHLELLSNKFAGSFDVRVMPDLQSVSLLFWDRAICGDDWSHPRLQHVEFGEGFREKDLRILSGARSLRILSLGGSRIASLAGIESLRKLKFLSLIDVSRLISIEGIQKCGAIEDVMISLAPKLENLEPLAALKRVKRLRLSYCPRIQSLSSLKSLRQLEEFQFDRGARVRDGRLSFLKKLPALKFASIEDRKGYDIRDEDLPKGNGPPWGLGVTTVISSQESGKRKGNS